MQIDRRLVGLGLFLITVGEVIVAVRQGSAPPVRRLMATRRQRAVATRALPGRACLDRPRLLDRALPRGAP